MLFSLPLLLISLQFCDGFYHVPNPSGQLISSQLKSIRAPIYTRNDQITQRNELLETKLKTDFNGNNIVQELFNPIRRIASNCFDICQIIWDFSRPHTLVGSGLSILSLYLYAIPRTLWKSSLFFSSLIQAIIPSLLTNIYITGLNQITDIEIDKINKPYLPIAAGKISKTQAIAIVSVCMILASLMVAGASWPLKMAVFGSAFLGTIYSLPPFRLKRFPLLAAICILVVRGTLVNYGFLLQAKTDVLGHKIPSLLRIVMNYPDGLLITSFFAIFGVVIALMKDVPDVRGDINSNIKTFSVRIGAKTMFRISVNLLKLLLASSSSGLFLASMIVTPGKPNSFHIGRLLSAGALAVLALDVHMRSSEVNADRPQKVFDYYMHIWKIFYFCYLLLPLGQ